MAISKTNFINYSRCKRYPALEEIRKDKLTSDMTIEEYKKEEENEQLSEILDGIFTVDEDGNEIDLTKKEDIQLNAMMDFYKEVELEAGRLVNKMFKGKSVYSKNTYTQESFDFNLNGIKYICYVDIYNENNNEINIIEVKATTSKKYKEMQYGNKEEKYDLFNKNNDIYYLNPCMSTDEKIIKSYTTKYNRLLDRFSDQGKYIFDLAVQRYIIEKDLKENSVYKKVNYYLAVLNADYVYDGYKEDGKRVYNRINDEEIISFFDLNDITKQMQPMIDRTREFLEENIKNPKPNRCDVGKFCALKKNTQCIYKDICFKNLPEKNTSFNYINFRSFKDENGTSYDKYDLINNDIYKLDDVPKEWLTNINHIIQRDCYDNDKVYVDKDKILSALNQIEYPIYHLDFESFPCPMPRFKGEKPYTQSCFEFSLHIEKEPGICDKEKDNFVFLAHTLEDERLELVKALKEHINVDKGTMLAQNVTFEKGRLKELAEIFPEYKEHLLKIREMGYDLLYIIKGNEKLFESLGYDKEDCKKINYYNNKQSGSYSIKKTLPLFTNLKYSDLDVQNGTEALVEYSKYDSMTEKEKEFTINALTEYCKQDTWAMVEILRGLRKLVK